MYSSGVGQTDVGKARTGNEDAYFIDDDLGLYIVSDGMGGHAKGEVASATAVETASAEIAKARDLIQRVRTGFEPFSAAEDVAKAALREACREVFRVATTCTECAGMGSTLTLLLVVGERAIMAHVGDTRLYLYRDGEVLQLSRDHTMAAELQRVGMLPRDDDLLSNPHRHTLTRSLGPQREVQIETLTIDTLPGDVFVLCSDGLTGQLHSPAELAPMLDDELDAVPQRLIDFALDRDGGDNITVVVTRIEAGSVGDTLEIASVAQEKLAMLREVELFGAFKLADLQALINVIDVSSYEDGHVVIEQGAVAQSLTIVLEGKAVLERDKEKVAELEPGDAVGGTMLLGARSARSALRAQGEPRVMTLEAERLRSLTTERPGLVLGLLSQVGCEASASIARWDAKDHGEDQLIASDLF